MSTNPYVWLLIPLAALVVIVLGGVLITRVQRSAFAALAGNLDSQYGWAGPSSESREEFVRRHWRRPGVVADGTTLVDLYDRIRALEERIATLEATSCS